MTESKSSTSITPHLACRNAAQAIEFYKKAFGAEPTVVHKLPDGRVMHAALKLDGALFFLCDEFPEHGSISPESIGEAR